MKGILFVVTVMAVPAPMPPTPLTATPLDHAFKKLSLPCPDRVHINDIDSVEEGDRFWYRPRDMYGDCADEMDALVSTKEPIDECLLQIGNKARELPERYRAAWILTQRQNTKVVAILEKMAASPCAEERYLAWDIYANAIGEKKLALPQSFDLALTQCAKEKNRYVQARIMGFLGACKTKEAVTLLTAALKDDSQYSAVHALGQIRDPSTVPAILARAKKETTNRHIYFGVLGRIGTSEAVEYLIEHLEESCFAVEALFESGSPKALPALERHLDQLLKKGNPDKLDFATTQISVLRLKNKDPREQLLSWGEDRKQSQWLRIEALKALSDYDTRPFADRILRLYREDTDDWMRMFYIRLLCDLPGKAITDAMIDQALTDDKNKYHFSHNALLPVLNRRLNTSFRSFTPLVEHLQREQTSERK